jgi:glycosyltransferase involved in cell wall biosynthesis
VSTAWPRIGFACLWDGARPETTWSYTPWRLREAMRHHAAIVDVGVSLRGLGEVALKAAHTRWRRGRLTTTWRQSPLTDAWCQRVVGRTAAVGACDAVLEIQDLAVLDKPFFVYQDLSFDALLSLHEEQGPFPAGLAVTGLPLSHLRRRQRRQREVYKRAAGVIAMSRWLARSLVETTGLPPEKVHVVNPGRSAVAVSESAGPIPQRDRPRRKLLLVGKGFAGKGGDLVVAALRLLRRRVDPQITLTVVGPPEWPLAGPVPEGVNFLGTLPPAAVARLYDSHDLFVMPSRLEGFGIAFAEALARGLPAIGRDAFAMPELIVSGVNGALVTGDDPANLADVVAAVLDDDQLYERCRVRAADVAAHFTWDRAASEITTIIRRTLE